MEEISELEATVTNIRNLSDRAIRDKRSAENELEKLTRYLPGHVDQLEMTIDELNCRLRASERERIEALHRAENLHHKLLRETNRLELEKNQYLSRSEDAYRRTRQAETELEESKVCPMLIVLRSHD